MTKPCAVSGCEQPVHCRGWCTTHYAHNRKHGSPTRQCVQCGGPISGKRRRYCSMGCIAGVGATKRTCTKCKVEFPMAHFQLAGKAGRHVQCRDCKYVWQKRSATRAIAEARPCRRCGTPRTSKDCLVCMKRPERRVARLRSVVAYQKRHPERIWWRRLRHRYGLTPEQYSTLRVRQGDRCGLCRKTRKLVVDHDHKTGVVRGLLCNGCNRLLGWYERNNLAVGEYIVGKASAA